MNHASLKHSLSKIKFGEVRWFESIGSTNDEALAWAADGAKDLSLVIADEQTRGRGRLQRTWYTPKGSALAYSIILRPSAAPGMPLSRTVGLAALSIADSCLNLGLSPQIKWPNDILVNNKKIAGILVESVWCGDTIDSLVIGMGINMELESMPADHQVQFPATCLEKELGKKIDREEFLLSILRGLVEWRSRMDSNEFIQAWEDRLAFRGREIQIQSTEESLTIGRLDGLEADGSLRVIDVHNNSMIVRFGDVSLRPVP